MTTREVLSTREFADALRAAAALLDTDNFDGFDVLRERSYAEQGETLDMQVETPDAVREFARRHGVPVLNLAEGRLLRAEVGFGRGVDHDATYGPSNSYKHAFTLAVNYSVPEAES